MDENPIWFWPALIGGSMVAGAVVWHSMTTPSGPEVSPEQAAAQARAAAMVERASLQQVTSPIIYTIPIMVGLGAFLLWKSRSADEVVP
jgi:hypothetical protein